MNEQVFAQKREPDWARLSSLCDRAEASPAKLEFSELREFVELYRRASADLATARTQSTNPALINDLNDLVARAYGLLYRAPRKPFWRALLDSLAFGAQAMRRRKGLVLATCACFFLAAAGAFLLQRYVPQTREFFVPPGFESSFEGWRSGKFEERLGGQSFAATGFYASNNPRASLVTGAVGAGTFGIYSVILILTNGALLGTLVHELAPLGHVDFLLSSIAPHGVPELQGIFIAGAAGVLFGWAFLSPGRRTRGAALREVAKDGIALLSISIVLMFIAAPIEGFFSFHPSVPGWAKTSFATVSLISWIAFWSFYGLTDEERARRATRKPQ
jgi:uncharacterized membrane protein SpoIIM required for sporulation